MQETPSQIWFLIARVLNGEATPLEQQELNQLLQQDETIQQQYELLDRIWRERHHERNIDDNINASLTVSRIISRAGTQSFVEERPERRKRRWGKRRSYVIGVVAAGLIGGAFMFNKVRSSTGPTQEVIITQKGSRSRTILADGTTVWLNAGSKLSYGNDFTGDTREVRLEGEAFFDVVKHAKRPFIVHTSGIDIRVLGTSFNVKAYPEDKNVETTLYRGAVEVLRPEDSQTKPIQLVPNQKLILAREAANANVDLSEDKNLPTIKPLILPVDSTKTENERIETAWVYSRLEFRGVSFEEVARQMERWYNITIVFTDEKAKKLNVIGTFEKETFEEAFAALKEAFPINYKINNHEISVESSE